MSTQGQQYSKEDIYQAIRNADAAGDSGAVQRLGQYLRQMDQGQVAQPVPTPQYTGLGRVPAQVGSALLKGASTMVDMPSMVGNALNSVLPNPPKYQGNDKLWIPGVGDLPGQQPQITPTLRQHGLVDNPAIAPQSVAGRYGNALVEAVPATAAAVASGGATLPMLTSGAGGALASQAAHDLAPDSTWAPIVAGLAFGLGVGGATGQVENWLNARNVNSLVQSTKAGLEGAASKLAEAKDAAFNGAKSLADKAAGLRDASKADFAATRQQIADDLAGHHAQQDQAIETVASGLGQSKTLQEAGTVLQSHARDWLSNTMPDKLDAAWAPVNAAVPKGMMLPLSQFTDALSGITKSAGDLESVAALLKPGLPAKIAAQLKAKTDLAELTTEGPSSAAQGQYSWQDVSKLRSALGDAMSNPKTVNDLGSQNMSRLYAALTTDMRVAADRAGAVPEFDAANAESRRLYQLAEGPMAKVVSGARASADDLAPEAVAKSLLSSGKAGASDLGALRAEIPQGVNELAAAQLRLDPKGFAKLSPEALGSLSPNSDHTATVLGTLAAKEEAKAAASAGVKLAQQQHQANVEQIGQALKDGKFSNASAVRSSSKALLEAKAAHADALTQQAALPKGNWLDHGVTSISGLLMGEELGRSVDPLLFKGIGLGGSIGAAVGALTPKIVQGGVNLLRPKTAGDLVYPLVGGTVGANALYGSHQ